MNCTRTLYAHCTHTGPEANCTHKLYAHLSVTHFRPSVVRSASGSVSPPTERPPFLSRTTCLLLIAQRRSKVGGSFVHNFCNTRPFLTNDGVLESYRSCLIDVLGGTARIGLVRRAKSRFWAPEMVFVLLDTSGWYWTYLMQ